MKDTAGTISLSPWLLTSLCELGNSLSVGSKKFHVVNEHREVRLLKKLQNPRNGLGMGTTQGHE